MLDQEFEVWIYNRINRMNLDDREGFLRLMKKGHTKKAKAIIEAFLPIWRRDATEDIGSKAKVSNIVETVGEIYRAILVHFRAEIATIKE